MQVHQRLEARGSLHDRTGPRVRNHHVRRPWVILIEKHRNAAARSARPWDDEVVIDIIPAWRALESVQMNFKWQYARASVTVDVVCKETHMQMCCSPPLTLASTAQVSVHMHALMKRSQLAMVIDQ